MMAVSHRASCGKVIISIVVATAPERLADSIEVISMRIGLDRIGGKLDRIPQSGEACRHQRFADDGEVAIIGHASWIPANNNKPAWLDHGCERAD